MNSIRSAFIATCLFLALSSLFSKAAQGDEVSELKAEIAKLRATIKTLEQDLEKVASERDALRLQVNRTKSQDKESETDAFQVGTRWTGSRSVRGYKKTQNWTFTVTERDGERFTGQIQFVSPDGQAQQLEVKGKAPTNDYGRLVFKTTAVGLLQQSFEGVFKGNQVSLNWMGTTFAGKRVVGTANLAR